MYMNTYQKGNRRELEARKILESQGYLVDRKNRSKYASPDLFGMFDLLAIRACEVLLVQVKSNKSDFYKARKEIRAWKEQTGTTVQCQLWLKENNKDWRTEVIN